MDRFRKGDSDAFEEIFRIYHSRFCHFANDILKDPAMSAAITAGKFREAWETRDEFESFESICKFFYFGIFDECLARLKDGEIYPLNDRQKWLVTETSQEKLMDFKMERILESEFLGNVDKHVAHLPEEDQKVFRDYLFAVPVELLYEQLGYTIDHAKYMRKRLADGLRYLQHWAS